MCSSNLLPHDNDLVPVGTFATAHDRMQTLRGINEGVLITPDKIDFAQLCQKVLTFRFDLQRAVNEVRRLIVQTVGHMEVGFGKGI